ncbi:MAG: glycosyltransferase family 2 protein [Clostridia bacterium]|nr:glycosyltransferase family 2 protein [Clostridia bacterium]
MQIVILLATHNSARFLRDQLDSLLSQTVRDFRIVAHDDASRDDTCAILDEYAAHDTRLTVLPAGCPCGSAQANFWFLLQNAPEADYYLFCDHDDVWFSQKIEKTLSAMRAAEDGDLPVLVHSDLSVTDENLSVLAPSLWRLQKLTPNPTFANNLVQNHVTGCSVMINRPLYLLAQKTPSAEGMIMHDWYLTLLALAFGRVTTVNEPLIFYRQHGNNEVGAKNVGNFSYLARRAARWKKNRALFAAAFMQAALLTRIYGTTGPLAPAADFAQNANRSKLARLRCYARTHAWKNTFLRRLGQLLFG